jgi:hypothetical protein
MRAPEFSASRRSIAEEQPVLRAKTITEPPSASRKVQVTIMHLGDDGQVPNEHRMSDAVECQSKPDAPTKCS